MASPFAYGRALIGQRFNRASGRWDQCDFDRRDTNAPTAHTTPAIGKLVALAVGSPSAWMAPVGRYVCGVNAAQYAIGDGCGAAVQPTRDKRNHSSP